MTQLEFDPETLRPVIEQAVAETISRLEATQAKFSDQLAYTEPEAAALLSVQPHVLRDLRLAGEIEASKVGRRIVYMRKHLIDYLERNRWMRP